VPQKLQLRLGVKSDPVQYRYSYPWLFSLLAEQDIHHVQLGSFFELYQLPDSWFIKLRERANDFGVTISSMFTAHRELGGFLRGDPEFEAVSRRNWQRLIEVGALLGAECVGSNAGAVLRDEAGIKPQGVRRYLEHMRQMAAYARERGLQAITIEPMSCLAEPPTTPEEIRQFAGELNGGSDGAAPVRYCTDVAHGYADTKGNLVHTGLELLETTLPWLQELHLKNTDPMFHSVFGFDEAERARGVVNVPDVVRLLRENASLIPRDTLIGYLELPGPKLGRDYSDHQLESQLRESLKYLKETFIC